MRYYMLLQLRNTANKIHTDNDGEKANPSVVETHRAAAIARLRSIILVRCFTSAGIKILCHQPSLWGHISPRFIENEKSKSYLGHQ